MKYGKTTIIFMAALLFAGAASADIGFTETEEIPEQFSGGDSFEINTSFENSEDTYMPMVFQLNVYNSTGHKLEHPEAFSLRNTGNNVEKDVTCVGNGGLVPSERGISGDDSFNPFGDYALSDRDYCVFNNVSGAEEHYSSFEVSTNIALEPGNYDVQLDLMAPIAMSPQEAFERLVVSEVGSDNDPVYEKGVAHNFSKEDVTVWVEPESSVIELERREQRTPDIIVRQLPPVVGDDYTDEPENNPENDVVFETPSSLITVKQLEDVNSETDEAEFVKGVQVVAVENIDQADPVDDQDTGWISEDIGLLMQVEFFEALMFGDDTFDAKASGNVTFSYEDSEMAGLNPQIYYLNTTSSQWESVESEVDGNTVTADVDHFSVYGLFGEEPAPDNTGSDEEEEEDLSSGPIPLPQGGLQEENSEEDDEDGSEIGDSGEDNENQDQDNNQQSDSTTPPGQNQDDDSNTGNQDQGNPITPQFVADNTGSLGLVGLLMLLAGAVYWKKEEVSQLATSLRAQYF
jgi:hypothetical protein